MSPSGMALVSGTSIRGFESLHPSHRNRPSFCLVYFYNLVVGNQIPEWHEGVKIASGNLQGDVTNELCSFD